MSWKSKLSRDDDTGYPEYDSYEFLKGGKHSHEFGGYSQSEGKYYEGGHGEDVDDEEKEEAGKIFRRERGDD